MELVNGIITEKQNDINEVSKIIIYDTNGLICEKELYNIPRIDRNNVLTSKRVDINRIDIILNVDKKLLSNTEYELAGIQYVEKDDSDEEIKEYLFPKDYSQNDNSIATLYKNGDGGIKVIDKSKYSKIALLVKIGGINYLTDWYSISN